LCLAYDRFDSQFSNLLLACCRIRGEKKNCQVCLFSFFYDPNTQALLNRKWQLQNFGGWVFIHCLNTIGSQQEISTIGAISYLLNLPNHKINHDFIHIPWYSLLNGWMNKKKIKMFKIKMITILMSIMKLSLLIKTHQINNISYNILG